MYIYIYIYIFKKKTCPDGAARHTIHHVIQTSTNSQKRAGQVSKCVSNITKLVYVHLMG